MSGVTFHESFTKIGPNTGPVKGSQKINPISKLCSILLSPSDSYERVPLVVSTSKLKH